MADDNRKEMIGEYFHIVNTLLNAPSCSDVGLSWVLKKLEEEVLAYCSEMDNEKAEDKLTSADKELQLMVLELLKVMNQGHLAKQTGLTTKQVSNINRGKPFSITIAQRLVIAELVHELDKKD